MTSKATNMLRRFHGGRIARTAALALCAAGLSACVGLEYGSNKDLEPQGSDFNKNLYAGYIALAGNEYDEFDHSDSDYFALKARGFRQPDVTG